MITLLLFVYSMSIAYKITVNVTFTQKMLISIIQGAMWG